jgi:hypothetical protein
MIECYVGNFVAFKEFGKTKITTKENYEAVIRDANKVITFHGTIHEAVEYIKQILEGTKVKQQLIDRIHAEHEEWLAELKQKPVDEIISKAYEICYREEFMSLLEADYLTEEEIAKLLRLPNPVGFLYGEWLKNDASICEMLEEVITHYLYEEA